MIIIVVDLCCILDEVGVTHCVEGNIVLNSEVLHAMSSDGSVVCLMNCVSNYMGLVDSSNHVEVDWIPAELKCLTDILQLNIANTANA